MLTGRERGSGLCGEQRCLSVAAVSVSVLPCRQLLHECAGGGRPGGKPGSWVPL